ncbi:MAG: hypothetical protein IPJ88_10565 [Myxococcales bacterium]|nr:MAG: hypothetical protein IPJ88_10565 [Myxococcales bacterium]
MVNEEKDEMYRSLEWKNGGTKNDYSRIILSGAITEQSDFASVLEKIDGPVVLNLSGIESINSIGVREWIRFIDKLCEGNRRVILEECSAPVVRQLNMISNMKGKASVASVLVPYYCGSCGNEQNNVQDMSDFSITKVVEITTCQSCGQNSEFDDLIDSYFAFFQRQID